MILDYLNALKNKGNFTIETISNLSGVPESTVKNIFSGKTEDPRFETVSAIVTAMGGSLNDINSKKEKEDIEMNAVIMIKEVYEKRIAELKEANKEHIGIFKTTNNRLWITACTLGFVLLAILLADVMLGNVGWIRY